LQLQKKLRTRATTVQHQNIHGICTNTAITLWFIFHNIGHYFIHLATARIAPLKRIAQPALKIDVVLLYTLFEFNYTKFCSDG